MNNEITVKLDWFVVPYCIFCIVFILVAIGFEVTRIADSLEKIASSTPALLENGLIK